MTTIQLRIDNATKKSAKKVLDTLGIDMTTAIKLYLKQIVIHQGIPFKLLTENNMTIDQEVKILKASKDAKKGKNISKKMTANEAMKYLNNL